MIGQRSRRLAVGLVGSLLFAAASCGSDSMASDPTVAVQSEAVAVTPTVGPTAAPVVTEAPRATDNPTTTSAAAVLPPAASAGGTVVNINEASASELEAAFDAAGVSNARRWAREVDEYRPYPTDPGFAKLRQELGKYNIDPGVLELIISTLEY
ncbi:MAG: hypothetical protein ABI894_07095 [Ilumatobacteraceae bacterium]